MKMKRIVHHLSFLQKLCVLPVYGILRLWYMTLKITLDEDSQRIMATRTDKSCVFYFWHHNLFVAPLLRKMRGNRPMYGLMSASKDGAWLESLVKMFHVNAIRGSSTWRGSLALKELEQYKQNCDIIITPDGPKGPRCVIKTGSVKWACQRNFNIISLKFEMKNAWKLKSWDRFHLPKPFSKIIVKANVFHPCQNEEISSLQDRIQKVL